MDLGLSNHREASFKDGCLVLRQSALEKQRRGCTIGPIYNPNFSASSRRATVRDISFGSGPSRFEEVPDVNSRPASAPGKASRVHHPGPMTYDPNAIKNATTSGKKNPPSVKFGTGKRACNADVSSSKLTPSPAEYDPASIRRGIMCTKRGAPSVHFGRAQSADGSRSRVANPGPSDYCPASIRRGIMCTKSSMPGVKFGSPPRKRSDAKQSNPSAQEYDTESIRRGVYSLSTKRRPAGVRFTTGPRTYNDAEERERQSKPGPCTYIVRSSLGEQVSSRYKSQPSLSFGAR